MVDVSQGVISQVGFVSNQRPVPPTTLPSSSRIVIVMRSDTLMPSEPGESPDEGWLSGCGRTVVDVTAGLVVDVEPNAASVVSVEIVDVSLDPPSSTQEGNTRSKTTTTAHFLTYRGPRPIMCGTSTFPAISGTALV